MTTLKHKIINTLTWQKKKKRMPELKLRGGNKYSHTLRNITWVVEKCGWLVGWFFYTLIEEGHKNGSHVLEQKLRKL